MGFRKHILPLLLIVSTVIMSGCTKEDNTDCLSGLNLTFNFSLNTDETNKFGELVNRTRVYFFDEHDILRIYAIDNGFELKYEYLRNGKIETIVQPNPYGCLPDDYVMSFTDLPVGKYRIFTFCGSNNGDNTTYFHGHMNNPENHNFERGITLGKTTMADFRLFLDYIDSGTQIIPTVDEIDDLWYGAIGTRQPQNANYKMETVEIKQAMVVSKHIDLVRNTNIIKFTVRGISNLSKSKMSKTISSHMAPLIDELGYNIWLVANNGRYKADNSAGENARTVRYNPYVVRTGEDVIEVDIKTLRLNTPKQDLQPMTLYLESEDKVITTSIDVLKVIKEAQDGEGNLLYPDIESMFKQYVYPIEIKIGSDLKIRIFIQGWEIVHVTPVQ